MAQVVSATQVKLNDGSVITAARGGWYDGRQFVGGSLSQPGQIHPDFGGVGAGQLVSPEVNIQADIAAGQQPGDIERFLQTQRERPQGPIAPTPGTAPTAGTAFADGAAGAAGFAGAGFQAPQAPDLVGQFDELLLASGIKEKEAELSEKSKAFTEARGAIDDNPFLSEASRVGRQAKLSRLFEERTANIRDDIAVARADAETKLNLQLKQFDIESDIAKQGLDQFNFLLESGALNNASGQDIANLTRMTGISSNLILGAIKQSAKKDVKAQVITSTDNQGNVTVSTINKDTGQVLSQQSLGRIGSAKVGKTAADVKPGSSQFIAENKGNVSNFLFNKTNKTGHVSPSEWNQALQAWLADGLGSRDQFIADFKNMADPNRGDFETQSGYGFSKDLLPFGAQTSI